MTEPSAPGEQRGIGIYSVSGDKIECDTCSLLPACHLGKRGWDCIMPKTNSTEVALTTDFGGTGKIEDALGSVLNLQAARIQKALDEGPGDAATPKMKADHQKELDRNINNLFKNGLALRNAKAASKTPTKQGIVLDDEGKEIPKNATATLLAWAIDDLTAAGLDRRSLSRNDAIEHLRAVGKILPETPDDVEF